MQTELGRVSVARTALGVVVGAIIWLVGFFLLAQILVVLWPAYAVPARIWMRTGAFTFTTTMALFNVAFWILAEIAGGWVAAVIARRAGSVWVLAAFVMGYLCFMHLYYAWHDLPWWYNLIVAFSSGPAVLLGGSLGVGADRPVATAPRATS